MTARSYSRSSLSPLTSNTTPHSTNVITAPRPPRRIPPAAEATLLHPLTSYSCFLQGRSSSRALASLSWHRAHHASSSSHAFTKKYENSIETPTVAITATKARGNTCPIRHLHYRFFRAFVSFDFPGSPAVNSRGAPLGIHTRKVDPCPTSLSTTTVPPRSSTSRLTICNPSPVP